MFAIRSFLFGRCPPAASASATLPPVAPDGRPLLEEVQALDRGTAWSTRRIRCALASDGKVRAVPARPGAPR